ncbi:hypothetical protein conserved [Leishmania donovani]|uniref:Uncharacterized protein n=3 Tax=Leishmania donovani species complex TaxID=38574 RepID=A4HYD6_LEIIN|nr:conserved hypothetical protein [Leishmania infantum JPCM5]CAC9483286.1 hypothetical_protein_-_conserved [Leishmania infantum]CAJ1988239.1 hypothetical protein conserved [Leishmania donovani]CAM67320.1 conserved hypothetical protein [Leishmania infantum JPCM5]SUZ41220.1 hypothetical_protein_-_conserved [Leishmania infantum]VDZ44125.1 hypothetical_protein_conserved [Leishmania donovani]|eukprot:XP_001465077.1 conserved hypothetical protein [Leishmania infantum JPCM5]
MSDGRSFWFSDLLRHGSHEKSELRGGGHSDSSDSSDRATEVFYDHQSGLPQHEPTGPSTARSGDSLAHQSLRLIPGGQQQQQQQPPTKQVPSASPTSSLDDARKGSVDSFPASTFASTASGATSSALVGTVDEAVVTMDHAVRVPSALRGAGRRTMFDVLVDVAARQRRQEQRQSQPQESAEGKSLASKPSTATRDAQVLAPHPSGTAASSLVVASSAREVTYQMLFPRAAVAAAAARMSSSGPTTPPAVGSTRELGKAYTLAAAPPAAASAAEPPSPSRSERIHRYTSPVSHRSPPLSSPPPPERAKPDRRLRHLLPAHLRGCPAASQSADDNSHRHQLQTARQHEANCPPARHAGHRAEVSALDVSDISSISSCSEDDTATPGMRHPPPHRGTRRNAAEPSAAASTSHPQAPTAVARPTLLSRLIDGGAEELVRLSHHREGRDRGEPDRPQGAAKEPKTRWALLEHVLMGTAGAAASSSHAGRPKLAGDRHRRRRSRHHRVGRTTNSGSSERSTTHSRTTDASASDPDSTSSRGEDFGHDGGGVVDLRRDLDDEVPQWVRQHEAARERLAQLQQQQQQFSWASPTFSNAHMLATARVAAADKARAQVATTAAASQAFFGKPRIFYPSSMARRTPSAASYAASGLAGGGAAWSTVSDVGRGRHDTRSALTAVATAAGVPRSLLAFWKEGKRLLKQRSSNATAVAVVEYLWQRFQAWKPCGLRLLHRLHSGFCSCEAAAPPAGSSLSRAEHESGPGRLLVNPACDDAVEDAGGPIEDISGTTSSDDDGGHASAVQSKPARKPRRVSKQASPQRRSRGTTGGGSDATDGASAQNKDEGKAGDAAAAVAAAEAGGGSDEGIELQMKVRYMESAFNVVAVHGELTYASEGACARLGLAYPLPPSPPCWSPRISGRADDAETTPAEQQRRWTFLVPEPALTQVPVLLQEYLYLAPPYTVLREVQTVLSSYNFTTDALLRQHAAEEKAAQEERQRRRALDASNVAGVAAQKTNASLTTAAVAGRAAADAFLEGHILDRGDGESGGRQRGVSPTRSGSLRNSAAASAPTRWWAALEGNDETSVVREAASIHTRAPADHADAPVANRSPTSLRREFGGEPVNLGPTRPGRATPLKHPQRRQWPVEDEEDTHLRIQSADGVEGHTPTAVRQCGSGCAGASPEPHQPPVSRFPPPLPPPLSDAENGCDAVNDEAQWLQGVPSEQPTVSPSYVRASTASVNSISIDGFYDPLAMPALPTTGAKRGIAAAWGANERRGDGGGSGTNGLAIATADVTTVLTRESRHGAGREFVPEDALERGLAAGPRQLPIPPQMTARPSNSLRSPGEVEPAAGVFGAVVGEDARGRGGNALSNEMSTVTAAAISADPLMDHRVGGGFPRGPTADWDIPVEVLFALSGGSGQWRERSEQPLRHTRRHRDAEVGSVRKEDEDDDGAPVVQQGLAGARSQAITSARFAQKPVHAHKRHRHETRTSDGAFEFTARGGASSALGSAAASQLASQRIPPSATFSFPTPRWRSASAASSLVSSAAPSSSSPSSLSEPEDGDDDGVKGGGTAHAARKPCWKVNVNGAVRWPRHGTRRSERDGVFVRRQQQQQERWIRELWGRGKQNSEPSVSPAAPSSVSAPAHAPAGPSPCSQHQQQTSQWHRQAIMCTSKPLSSAVDASISAMRAASASARAAPITSETGGNAAMNSAPRSSPLPDEDSAAMASHADPLTSLSSLEAIVRGVPSVPVLHQAEDADASTATASFFALEDVYLSDTD